jgi:hypothetical protein
MLRVSGSSETATLHHRFVQINLDLKIKNLRARNVRKTSTMVVLHHRNIHMRSRMFCSSLPTPPVIADSDYISAPIPPSAGSLKIFRLFWVSASQVSIGFKINGHEYSNIILCLAIVIAVIPIPYFSSKTTHCRSVFISQNLGLISLS